jgi:GGDEF domain-containing protein
MIATTVNSLASNWPGVERRQDHERRARVSEMSREELIRELLTDPVTGIGNLRQFREHEEQRKADRLPTRYAVVDVDSLKWVNDQWGHAAGDALLCAVAWVLASQARIGVYRTGGDEFVVMADDTNTLEAALLQAYLRLEDFLFEWKDGAGQRWGSRGATFTYGVAATMAVADAKMTANKQKRERSGLRASRGEKPANLNARRVRG